MQKHQVVSALRENTAEAGGGSQTSESGTSEPGSGTSFEKSANALWDLEYVPMFYNVGGGCRQMGVITALVAKFQ